MGFYMMSSSGVSAHQLHRSLNLGYKSAWFMCHRIREAMRSDSNSWSGPFGCSGKVVGADETYFGSTDEPRRLKKPRVVPYTTSGKSVPANKRAIVALVEHGGNVRTFRVRTADKIAIKLERGSINADSTPTPIETVRHLAHFLNVAGGSTDRGPMPGV